MRSLPTNLSRYVRLWRLSSIAWNSAYHALGAIAVMLPLIIASGLIEDSLWGKLLALGTAAATGLQLFLKCDKRADRFHAAFRLLNYAKLTYENTDDYPLSDVTEAYKTGEEFIWSAFAPIEPQPLGQRDSPIAQ